MTFSDPMEAINHVLATEEVYQFEAAEIDGITYRVFKNAPRNVAEYLDVAREKQGKEFLVYQGERLTFPEFEEQVNRLGSALKSEYGIKQGDRVAIAMRNYPEFLTSIMAITSIGGVVVYLNRFWTTAELKFGLELTEAKLAIVEQSISNRMEPFASELGVERIVLRPQQSNALPAFESLLAKGSPDSLVRPDIHPDSDYAIMFTSGSTGEPKGVVQTHRGVISTNYSWNMGKRLAELLGIWPQMPTDENGQPIQPSTLITTPVFHVTAAHGGLFDSMISGWKIILMDKWDANEAVRLIKEEQITRVLGVPTMAMDIIAAAEEMGESLPTLRLMDSGGAKRPASQVGEINGKLPQSQLASGYGMTETNGLGLSIRASDYSENPDATGRLFPPLQDAKIVDDDGAEVPIGEVGELIIKSPANMRCYLKQAE